MPPPTTNAPSDTGSGLLGSSAGGVRSADAARGGGTPEQQQDSLSNASVVPTRRRRVDSNAEPPDSGVGEGDPFAPARRSPKRIRSDEYTTTSIAGEPTGPSPSPFHPRSINHPRSNPFGSAPAPTITKLTTMSVVKGPKPMATLRGGATPHGSRTVPRTLVIKNRRADSGVSGMGGAEDQHNEKMSRYFENTWCELDEAVDAALDGQRLRISLDRLYRGVQELCRSGNAEKVYDRLVKKVETRAMEVEAARLKTGGQGDHVLTLEALRGLWKEWNEKSKIIRTTFSHLDRTFLLKHKKLLQINDMLIQQFKKMLFNQPVKGPSSESTAISRGEMAISGMCKMIQADREGLEEGWNAELLRESVTMLHVLSAYTKRFEPFFITRSTEYFKEFAERRNLQPLKEYITGCRILLDREMHRCSVFNFDPSTKRLLIGTFQKHGVENYQDKLLDDESLFKLLEAGDDVTLQSLYYLLSLSGMEKRLLQPWGLYIRNTGAAIIKDKERGDEMVPRLLLLRRSLDIIIRDSFSGSEEFLFSLREGFGEFMNEQRNFEAWDSGASKIGEMIAKYIDGLLRGGLKALPPSLQSTNRDLQHAQRSGLESTADEDTELDRQLDQALELFRFIQGKDAFEAFYKRALARRLLLDRSASQDAERSMLAKLRGECGANFTHNLEQMFKDKDIARDEMENYRQFVEGQGKKSPFDMSVMILSAAAWPAYPDTRINMPPEVHEQMEKFDAYYRNKHTGRVLTWKHSLAHCVVRASFPKGTKELAVSALQAAVLILFNDAEDNTLSYDQISRATGLTGQELDRALQSLACGRVRVLTKHPKGKDVRPTDTFSVNLAFSDPKVKVKINQIQMRESKEETKATHDKIARDRKLETQAAIVRIMKSRKKLAHAVLVAEVIGMTRKRGPVDAAEIKLEIESLIEKDYLEREGGSYVYLA